jgi:carbamate kinase
MRIVVALGGNALLRRGDRPTAAVQRRNARTAAEALAPVAKNHQLVITHGNGPQVGLLVLQAAAYEEGRPYPLDVLGTDSEGMIGERVRRRTIYLAATLGRRNEERAPAMN